MNQKNKITIYAMIIACCTNVQKSNAQWANFGTPGFNTFNQTSQPNREESAGIGDFNSQGPLIIPLSAFHINTNFFNTYAIAPSYPLGEVFRSDCPTDISSYWRMFRGNAERTDEYGRLHSLSNADDVSFHPNTQTGEGFHFTLQSSFADRTNRIYGDLRFNTPAPASF